MVGEWIRLLSDGEGCRHAQYTYNDSEHSQHDLPFDDGLPCLLVG